MNKIETWDLFTKREFKSLDDAVAAFKDDAVIDAMRESARAVFDTKLRQGYVVESDLTLDKMSIGSVINDDWHLCMSHSATIRKAA